MNRAALWISVGLHPMVMLLATSLVTVFAATQNLTNAMLWTLYAVIFVAILSIFVALGIKHKKFSNADVSRQSQRSYLYLAATILAGMYLVGLIVLTAPNILYMVGAVQLCLVGGLGIANRWIKASGHVACVSIFALALMLIYGIQFLPLLLLIPLIAWSRIRLQRHTLPEAITGCAIGIASVLLAVLLSSTQIL